MPLRVPIAPPPFAALEAQIRESQGPERLLDILSLQLPPTQGGRYRHWDGLRHRDPPQGFSHEEWWIALKSSRRAFYRELPLRDTSGKPFVYAPVDLMTELQHWLDREASGSVVLSDRVTTREGRERYIVSSLVEEAITSSQLEGASTTRRVAAQMLRSGRKPATSSERMIFNNFRVMQRVRELRDEAMSPDLILELHRLVTDRTLEDPSSAGRLRVDDAVRVWDGEGNVLHTPPPHIELPERVERMCRFAKGETPTEFLHPVLRAIILHFWLAYDHPFEDGNGRTARALFYWSMLSQGYWIMEYVSISSILKAGYGQYARSFLYTETDENDLSYFILHQMDVLRRAVVNLREYLERKSAEMQRVEALLRKSEILNSRQLALLGHAVRHPRMPYTVLSHRNSHNIAVQTARMDLEQLVDLGLMGKRKTGKKFIYEAPEDLEHRLAKLPSN